MGARDAQRHRVEEAEAQLAREQEARDEKIAAFLKAEGFSGVNAGRRKMLKTSYPLHAAVARNDAAMVKMLLQAKSDPNKRNSSGVTPGQQALRLNKDGSHYHVLCLL